MNKITLFTLEQHLGDRDKRVIQRFGEGSFGDKFRIIERTGLMAVAAIGGELLMREGGGSTYRKIHKKNSPK